MNKRFFLYSLILMTSVSICEAQPPAEALKILYPTFNRIATSSSHHYLVGTADTSKVAGIEISNFVEKTEEIEVQPATLIRDYPRLVQRLFGSDFHITHMTTRLRYKSSADEDREITADFLAENRVDLQTFWESKEFQRIYSSTVRDAKATHVNVLMRGYRIQTIDLRSQEHKEKFGNYFVFLATLNPGLNEILLRALDSSGRTIQELPFSYIYKSRIDKKTEIPTSFAEISFHSLENEERCVECHRLQLMGTERISRSATSKICYPCHKQMTEGKFVHGPVSTWTCLYCHQDQGDTRSRFAAPDESRVAELCYECHKASRSDLQSKPHIHGPVASGDCNLCHSPHGSNHAGQIWMPANQLCLTCHGDRYSEDHPVVGHPIRGMPDPLNPNRELSCVSCHNPHSSDSPDLFYSATGLYQLCQECHKK